MVEIPEDEIQRLPVMLWRARPDMACELISRQWLEFTGFEEAQALGDGWSRAVHPEDLPRWLDTCLRAFDAREPYELEYRLRRRDGEYHWVLERGTPRHSGAGEFLGFTGICLDIDERKHAERALARALARERRLHAEAEETSRAKDGLLSGVRVLIVDEDPAARDHIARVLRVAGAQTRAARSIPEAIDAVSAFRPDVILSGVGVDEGQLDVRAGRERETQLAKPVEPLALLATVARLAEPAHL
jgi:PAS domain S-box-containing protein